MANIVGFKVGLFSHIISGCWFGNRCFSVISMYKGLFLLIISFPRGKKVPGLQQVVSNQAGGRNESPVVSSSLWLHFVPNLACCRYFLNAFAIQQAGADKAGLGKPLNTLRKLVDVLLGGRMKLRSIHRLV